MCGFVGWLGGQHCSYGVLERAARLLRHRGPDDRGYEHGLGWGLAFRRLSILDLSPLGHQPMFSCDGRYVLVFNGEIYNYVELRQELEREGERFRSGSDTEVLLTVLARLGIEGLSKLNGMFALALVDTWARTFILARDRLGVKPLYYARRGGQLRFASELKALFAWPDSREAIEPAAIGEYLALGYLSCSTGAFIGYEKLEPGCLLTGSLDRVMHAEPMRYWALAINDDPTARGLTSTENLQMQELLADAVRVRLRSDVPLGIFLSGGIDSALVAVMASRVSDARPLALTIGFNDESTDESALARATAHHAGLEHQVAVQEISHLADLDRLAWFYDEPFGDASALPTFMLCKMAAEHATVFLSGDGGDEAFGGYRRYIESVRHRRLVAIASRLGVGLQQAARVFPKLSALRYRLEKLSLREEGCAAVFDGVPADPVLSLTLHPDLRDAAGKAGSCLWRHWSRSGRMRSVTARQQQLDYSMYLPDDILTKVDRASMAHSIEVRSPFLDYRLVEWAAKLPRGALLNQREGKLPLRISAEKLLPKVVARGVKRGFTVPLDRWFREPVGVDMVHDRLLSPGGRQLGLWDPRSVERVLSIHRSQRGRSFGWLLWRLLMLEAWSRHYATGLRSLEPPRRLADGLGSGSNQRQLSDGTNERLACPAR